MQLSSLFTSTTDARISARSTAGRLLKVGRAGRRARIGIAPASPGDGLTQLRRQLRVARLKQADQRAVGRAIGRRPAPRRTCCCAGTLRETVRVCAGGAPERPPLVEENAPGPDREQSQESAERPCEIAVERAMRLMMLGARPSDAAPACACMQQGEEELPSVRKRPSESIASAPLGQRDARRCETVSRVKISCQTYVTIGVLVLSHASLSPHSGTSRSSTRSRSSSIPASTS